jgi:hypothetical protein
MKWGAGQDAGWTRILFTLPILISSFIIHPSSLASYDSAFAFLPAPYSWPSCGRTDTHRFPFCRPQPAGRFYTPHDLWHVTAPAMTIYFSSRNGRSGLSSAFRVFPGLSCGRADTHRSPFCCPRISGRFCTPHDSFDIAANPTLIYFSCHIGIQG